MPTEIVLTLSPKQASSPEVYMAIAARRMGVAVSDIALAQVIRRSVDARSRSPKINIRLRLFIDNEHLPEPVVFDYKDVSSRPEVIIVGSGPAGLFAALRLIELGLQPVILERGKAVSDRKKDIASINRGNAVDPDSNYSFGEGGAGTFSDGKLYTRSKKRGDHDRALRILVDHGAREEILHDAHPHIGTDKLPGVISNIRKTILECGGIFSFDKKVTAFEIKNDVIEAVRCGNEKIEAAAVILATGHSARDIYTALHSAGVYIEAKPYAMGVRIEHPQQLIDSIQYHMPERGEYLPAASYSLVSRVGDRGVYSFCMCPGGFVVPAMTSSGEIVVNGMSPSQRNSPYANSGIVTEIRIEDFAFLEPEYGPLAGMRFQQMLEESAALNGGAGNKAPAQKVADFVNGRRSGNTLPESSYVPGLVTSPLHEWLPEVISSHLRHGIASFGRKMRGFVTNEAVVIGVESRTSTPVRIPRDPETLQHLQIKNLYPAAEGAGYAGGIISAALDGTNIAHAVHKAISTR